jgi:putative membrane protein
MAVAAPGEFPDRWRIRPPATRLRAVNSAFDPAGLQTIEAAVADAEKKTASELVVVLARRSGHALMADIGWGLLGALCTLTFVLVCPWEIAAEMVVPDVVCGFFVGALLSSNLPDLQRVLVPEARALKAVSDGAKIAFMDHAVGATRDRTGILIYYSDRERDLVILPDLGIQGRVPGHRFNAIRERFRTGAEPVVERLSAAIRAVGEATEAEFPRTQEDKNELPDAPRVQE